MEACELVTLTWREMLMGEMAKMMMQLNGSQRLL